MKYIILAFLLSGCSTAKFQTPNDYYYKRQDQLREDSINWGPNANNNMMDSSDGSAYYNRNVEIFGAKY